MSEHQEIVDRLREANKVEKNVSTYAGLCRQAADFIERQARIIPELKQQVQDGAAVIAEKDAEIERLRSLYALQNELLASQAQQITDCRTINDAFSSRALAAESERDAAVKAEREACAEVVCAFICKADWPPRDGDKLIDDLQAAIRSRDGRDMK